MCELIKPLETGKKSNINERSQTGIVGNLFAKWRRPSKTEDTCANNYVLTTM